ncbi:transcription factor Dp-1 [Panicum miliaceum]|uniref:Transcription factor Dp-1 n=1 Tax=Panicum miliaceum TaxID=4540 RepID=A0A3L6TSU2_PANMI|nr:transcription factor Dp-1 [Panicum miliaceum]
MVSGVADNPDGDGGAQRPPPPVGARAALDTPPVSAGAAHSASTSGGSAGSPSSRSEQHAPDGAGKGAAPGAAAAASASTPASESTFLRLNNLDINGDDAPSSQAPTSKKKKRGARAVGPDKGNRGLRQFSMKVCEKVESKGRTTYNEVADELVAEFTDPNNNIEAPDPDNPNAQQYDEKNIRRRVYDALNVLMAMDIISKDKKEIQWKGLPRTSISDIEELKTELVGLKGRIEKKSAYLQELQDQCYFFLHLLLLTTYQTCDFHTMDFFWHIKYVGLQNLIQRNEQLYGSGNTPSGGVALPFILVQTRPHATVEVEISEDMQLVHFDFNSTPFELHDDSYVLKAMQLCGREQHDSTQEPISNGGESSSMSNIYWQQVQHAGRPNNGTVRLPASRPIPGILKGRVKHEH